MINPIAFVFLGLFIVSAITHLIFCFFENEKYRKISKPFTIPFLVVALILIAPNYPLIYLFPIFSWIGDIFLIWKKKHLAFFVAGTFSFIIGHTMILIQMIIILSNSASNLPVTFYVVLGIFFALVVALFYQLTGKRVGRIALLGSFYMPYLLLVGLFSILVIGAVPESFTILLTFIGYAFFIFSDAFLIFTSFIKDKKRRDFYVMSTYFLGEVLITLGLVLFFI